MIVMAPSNAITQEALHHFEMAYRYMDGTLAQEPQVKSRYTFKIASLINPT